MLKPTNFVLLTNGIHGYDFLNRKTKAIVRPAPVITKVRLALNVHKNGIVCSRDGCYFSSIRFIPRDWRNRITVWNTFQFHFLANLSRGQWSVDVRYYSWCCWQNEKDKF